MTFKISLMKMAPLGEWRQMIDRLEKSLNGETFFLHLSFLYLNATKE